MNYAPPKPELRARIAALHAAGKPDREIAAALGITKNVVIGHRTRGGMGLANVDQASPNSIAAGTRDLTPPETLFDRMNAIEARMNAVLAANPPGLGLIANVPKTSNAEGANSRTGSALPPKARTRGTHS